MTIIVFFAVPTQKKHVSICSSPAPSSPAPSVLLAGTQLIYPGTLILSI